MKIRVILNTEDNVFRDIIIHPETTLLDFHHHIKQAFQMEGDEMASFYLSNDAWFQGSEIPMEDMTGETDAETMATIKLSDVISKKGGRMIYVYDFFTMWTFYCEAVDMDTSIEPGKTKISLSVGHRPESAPEIKLDFEIEEDEDDEAYDEDMNSYY